MRVHERQAFYLFIVLSSRVGEPGVKSRWHDSSRPPLDYDTLTHRDRCQKSLGEWVVRVPFNM